MTKTLEEFALKFKLDADTNKFKSFFDTLTFKASALGAALTYLATKIDQNLINMGRFSTTFKVPLDVMEKFSLVSNQIGVSTEGAENTIKNLTLRIAEASRGFGQGLQAFRVAGINIRKTNGEFKNFADILLDLAKLFEQVKNPAQQSQLLGQFGIDQNYLFLLQKGEAATRKYFETTKGLLTPTKDNFNSTLALSNSIQRLTSDLQVLGQKLLAFISPALSNIITKFDHFLEKMTNSTLGLFNFSSTATSATTKTIEIGAAIIGLTSVFKALSVVLKATKFLLFSTFRGNIIGLAISAAVVGIDLLLENFDKVKKAAQSFFNFFKQIADKVKSFFSGVASSVGSSLSATVPDLAGGLALPPSAAQLSTSSNQTVNNFNITNNQNNSISSTNPTEIVNQLKQQPNMITKESIRNAQRRQNY